MDLVEQYEMQYFDIEIEDGNHDGKYELKRRIVCARSLANVQYIHLHTANVQFIYIYKHVNKYKYNNYIILHTSI